MQLRTFAEQVLFGQSLEEKLSFPKAPIVDTHPGAPVKTPTKLPRPANLQLNESGIQVPPPRLHQLNQDQERGKLLHFFCNHELLATELMALVLLKFPDAPPSFRQGVLHTLKEEQIHTQLYIHRMQQCGIHFGELPVNGYFWKTIAPMHDPLDYVTRLSLTFEQANLDYSKSYARVFAEMGDAQTSKILEKIYLDEIEHVGFGLKWFRQWKARETSDWSAFKAKLQFPLSPSRAKGPDFNADARRKVGLDATFIDELSLFSQSKGRTPNVYYFNPLAELEWAQSSPHSPTADAHTQCVEQDLANIPIFLAKRDDIALVRKRPRRTFLKKLQAAGFELPEIIVTAGDWNTQFERKINTLRPWAWTPSACHTLRPLFERNTQTHSRSSSLAPTSKHLFDKTWSARWLKTQLDTQWQPIDDLLPADAIGQSASSLAEALHLIDQFRARGYSDSVLKAPFGLAGRNQQRLLNREPLAGAKLQWAEKIIAQQSCILVEPWLQRVIDFSAQYESTDTGTRFLGITRLHNTAQGQFTAASTHSLNRNLTPDVRQFIYSRQAGRPWILHFFARVCGAALNQALLALNYTGPVGIDAFIYRTADNRLKLKPVVEINPRYTMGRVALEMQTVAQNRRPATFAITALKSIQKMGFRDFSHYTRQQMARYPLELNAQSKIRYGFIPLNDPDVAKNLLMTYQVGGQP